MRRSGLLRLRSLMTTDLNNRLFGWFSNRRVSGIFALEPHRSRRFRESAKQEVSLSRPSSRSIAIALMVLRFHGT